MSNKVRKAVFPVAGLGTRFLPATKASPKEMLPIVDKPLIQYAAEEAVAAGITELIFVTGRAKRAIPDHFDKAYELEAELEKSGKDAMLEVVRNILPPEVSCIYIRQAEPLGLGHAVLCARPAVGEEPFAVLLADDLIDGEEVPRRWDQMHAANLLVGYRVDDAWTAAVRVAYHSGWPTTPIDPLVVMEGGETEIEQVFGPRNSARFSSYFRVDLKLSRAFTLQRGRLRLELEVVNVLDRENVCCVDAVEFELLPDGSIERETEFDTWLGITPTASIGWDF